MFLLDRQRAPSGGPAREVAWPVTAFRVEVRAPTAIDLDPFESLLLDVAAAEAVDPKRVAAMTGLPEEFVRSVTASLNGQGALDGHGRLTDAGRLRRERAPVDLAHPGWMLRDDLTGEPLPVFLPRLPFTAAPPEDAAVLTPVAREDSWERSVHQARLIDAFHADRRLRREAGKSSYVLPDTLEDAGDEATPREGTVRILDSGTWQEILVEVRGDLGAVIYGGQPRIEAGCPFGFPGQGARYLARLRGSPEGQAILRDLEVEVQDEAQGLRADLADSAFREAVERAMADLLPTNTHATREFRDRLHEAEIAAARAERGSDGPNKALVAYGVVAEAILVHLAARRGERPGRKVLAAAVASLPDDPRTRGRWLRERIARLLPRTDDGEGLRTPGHLESETERFVAHVIRERCWPSVQRVGRTRQLLPFGQAAVAPDTPQAHRLQQALERHRELWGDLCRSIDFRNDAAHARVDRGLSDDQRRQRMTDSRAGVHRCVPAVFSSDDGPDVSAVV